MQPKLSTTWPPQESAAARSKSTLLDALTARKTRPAVMHVTSLLKEDEVHNIKDGGEGLAVLEIELWRADALTSVMELDRKLAIERADPAAGLIFGVPYKQLLRKSFSA